PRVGVSAGRGAGLRPAPRGGPRGPPGGPPPGGGAPHGRYTGEVEFYCYGEGKVTAIEKLAASEGYDLSRCYAYSDSITDLPMLGAVGHPTAVNPDRALRREAIAREWPVLTFSNPISLWARFQSPSSTTVAATAVVGFSAVLAGTVSYRLLRKRR
ncbi:HAD family hydrolase, partial [Nocardia farcinica]|uniref:HAD family hydrolase n=1 Tax=Nocardia farcinica TaxID=37329 RepID=UPI002455D1CE